MFDIPIIYFTPTDVMIPRVDRKCIVMACEGIKRSGGNIKLISLYTKIKTTEIKNTNILDLYAVKNKFKYKVINTIFLYQNSTSRLIAYLFTIERFLRYSHYSYIEARKNKEGLIFYSKNYSFNLFFIFLKRYFKNIKLVFELHYPPKSLIRKYILNKMDLINTNTETLKYDIKANNIIKNKNIISTHQGINIDMIESIRVERNEAKIKLKLDIKYKYIVYTGKVIRNSLEVEYIMDLSNGLNIDTQILIVGGQKDIVDYYKGWCENRKYNNVKFIGYVSPVEVYYYQFAADVLISYYESGLILNRYRSPGKLFEYMASKSPIISADYPSIREVLKDKVNCLLIEPDNIRKLSESVRWLLMHPDEGEKLALRAYKDVIHYTWDKRGKYILENINKISN